MLIYSCKLKSTVFSLPKRGFSSKKYNLRCHFETQHPNLAELDANEKRLKAYSLGTNLRSEQNYFKPSSNENAPVPELL